MADEKRASLPHDASLEWLRKHAKKHLRELQKSRPDAQLADAQLDVAREFGFPSWRALKAHIDSLSIEGQLFAAAKSGDVETLRRLIGERTELRDVRDQPYAHSLLHAAAQHAQLGVVEYLIDIGADVNYREKGDNTVAMHWAAAAGSLPVVRALADAGSDLVGDGDDHAMGIIGWACMWDGAQDQAHRDVVAFLLSRGAKHHIFSAIAMNLPDEVRRIVKENPKALAARRSRNENFETALHYAVGQRNRDMVQLLLDLGADFNAGNDHHFNASINATTSGIDDPILQRYRSNHEASPGTRIFANLALDDRAAADAVFREHPQSLMWNNLGALLHLMAKRGNAAGVRWYLEHSTDPNKMWRHYDAMVTPMHMAILGGHADVVKVLLEFGAEPKIKDTKHDADAMGWAEFFGRVEIVRLLRDAQK